MFIGFPRDVTLCNVSRWLERLLRTHAWIGWSLMAGEWGVKVSHIHLAEKYWLEFLSVPMWTWTNSIGSSRSYLDRIFCRPVDNSISCPYFKAVSYTNNKFVICTVYIDRSIGKSLDTGNWTCPSQRVKLSETELVSKTIESWRV